tara:strand:- start:331 stop:564 length:234 start_codon:yes stop_codon:yes gene_type:complete
MAWVDVPGSSNVWQYENTATAANTYSDSGAGANSAFSGGVRTYTKPGGGTVKVYARTRKKGETKERGELSKTYYDNQ